MTDHVSNQILVERIDGLKTLIEERFSQQHEIVSGILQEAKQTNGRLRGVEVWKGRVVGGLMVSNIIIVPILLWLIYKHLGT
jgi:hypothetical protein